ncbi:hypothetical protein LCGC14_0890070 [marine sediment metagenome]|uniref:Large polyvalent protein associated domain-containing protein n=1 Tax=marine sediment metagenome TaxID=412755 RepID=A0A0F9PKB4_9ZZZZ
MAIFENWGSEDVYRKSTLPLSPPDEGLEMLEEAEEVKEPDFLWKLLTSKINPVGLAARFAISPKKEVEAEVVEPIPIFRRFGTEEKTEEFMALSDRDKAKALVWDGLEIAAFVAAPLLIGAYGAAGKFAFGKAAKTTVGKLIAAKAAPVLGPKVLPMSTLSGLKTFSYETALRKKLRSHYKGIADDEVAAVSSTLQDKELGTLRDVILSRAVDKTKPTEGFNKLVLSKGPLGIAQFREGLAERLSPEVLRGEFYKKRFRKELSRLKYKGEPVGLAVTKAYPEAAFQKQAEKFLGEEGLKLKIGEASEEQVATFLADMVRHPDTVLKLRTPHGQKWFTTTTPMRTTFGYGDPFFQTHSKVYKPGTEAIYNARTMGGYETLTWHNMLYESGGFYKQAPTLDKLGRIVTKTTKEYTPQVMEKSGKILQKLDDLSQAATRKPDWEGAEDLKRQMAKVYAEISEGDPLVGKFIKVNARFMDHLYGDRTKQIIPMLFEDAGLGLTGRGRGEIDNFVEKAITPIVDRVFYRSHLPEIGQPINHATKQRYVEKILEGTRTKLDQMVVRGDMFTGTGKGFESKLAKLKEELTLIPSPSREHKGFLGYLDHYVRRIGSREAAEGGKLSRWSSILVGKPGYTKPRTEVLGPELNFEQMFSARVNAQMKELYLYPTLEKIVQHSKGLPKRWRQHIEHWISNSLGRPSVQDEWWAANVVQRIPGMKGKSVEEAMQTSRALVTVQYTAGLGFKTFSPKRNLFQPLISIPTELGGPRGMWHWAKGLVRATDPKERALLREIGVITDYAPDIAARGQVAPWLRSTKRTIGKKEMYTIGLTEVQNSALWAFKGTDHINRYVSGAAALNKWESGLKFLNKGDDFKRFLRRSGVFGKDPLIKNSIHDLLRLGGKANVTEARNIFVRDTVGGTQYLYGVVEAPPAISSLGTVGKNVFIYQSWWMNYGEQWAKWYRTGDASTKVGRMFNIMVSSAVAAEAMGVMWDTGRVVSSVFLGPFPGQYGLPIPPILQPFITMGKLSGQAVKLMITGPRELSRGARKRIAALLSTPVSAVGNEVVGLLGGISQEALKTVVPGGQQIRRSIRDVQKGGLPGLSKEIFEVHERHRYGWKPITPVGRLALGFLKGGR